MFLRDGGNPDVVFRNGRAGFRERRADSSVVIGRGQAGEQHHDGREEAGDLGQRLGRVRGEMIAAVKFAQRGLREIERGAGLDLPVNRGVFPEVAHDDGCIQQHVTTRGHRSFRNSPRWLSPSSPLLPE